jgi:uracil-DNA glycosylase family 4
VEGHARARRATPTAVATPAASPPAARAPVPPGALDPEEAPARARALAEAAQDLSALEAALESFEGCALKAYAKSFVYVAGRRDAKVVFMGFTPTSEEDRTGRLLEGREGVLLDNILAALGLSREDILFVRAVPWRPAGARVPTKADLAACRPFAVRLLRLVSPHSVVCLGSPLTQMLFAETANVKKLQGRWQALPELGSTPRILPTFDLDRLLKMPSLKGLAWRDLRALRKALDEGR